MVPSRFDLFATSPIRIVRIWLGLSVKSVGISDTNICPKLPHHSSCLLHNMSYLTVPDTAEAHQRVIQQHADDFRQHSLGGHPDCLVCCRPPAYALSPIPHTFFCSIMDLYRCSVICRRCWILFKGVTHFMKLFGMTSHETVTIRYEMDNGEFSMRGWNRARVEVDFGMAAGRKPIDLHLSIDGPCELEHTLDTLVTHWQHLWNHL